MISDTIIVAIISGAVTSFGSILGFTTAEKGRRKSKEDKQAEELKAMEQRILSTYHADKEEYMARIDSVKNEIANMKESRHELVTEFKVHETNIMSRLDVLEKKQDVHNNLITRMYGVEGDIKALKEHVSMCPNLDDKR